MAGKLGKMEGNGPPHQGSREEGFSGLKKEGGLRGFVTLQAWENWDPTAGGMRIGVGAGSSEGEGGGCGSC